MKTTIKTIALSVAASLGLALTSCNDMLTKESDYYVYADEGHLNSAADTVNSVLGILNKLQTIAVRTNLLGEVRADLVTLNSNADINLRELANNAVSDDNKYNSPVDYYAVINNCNYFLAYADGELRNTAKDTIFRKEIDAVRVYRAWTYLQLAMNYGRVPLVTEPILTEAQAQEWEGKPSKSFLEVCDYFINDLETNYKSNELPEYGKIDERINPLLVFFPRYVVLGDLYLWRNALTGSVSDAKKAALCYYHFIRGKELTGRSGMLTSRNNVVSWRASAFEKGDFDADMYLLSTNYSVGDYASYCKEYITAIPMDSASNQPNYNQLRMLYNSREDNDYMAAILPSEVLKEISRSQVYCYVDKDDILHYPLEAEILSSNQGGYARDFIGDLRYAQMVSTGEQKVGNEMRSYQYIRKQNNADIYIYNTGMIYLRFAEALNAAGYPTFALALLKYGYTYKVINNYVFPYLATNAEREFVNEMPLPTSSYYSFIDNYYVNGARSYNMIGIHSRGCGNTEYNEHYYNSSVYDVVDKFKEQYTISLDAQAKIDVLESEQPDNYLFKIDSIKSDDLSKQFAQFCPKYIQSVTPAEQNAVDSLLQVEWALEECFDGTRFYNLMRADYRKRNQGIGWTNNPLSVAVSRRDPSVGATLLDENNWYIKWQGKVGR